MTGFKQLFITLKEQVDSFSNEFVNHEALAGAAIKDLESLGPKTSIHLHRAQNLIRQTQLKLDELQHETELWSARAIKVRDEDEQKALACVKRIRMLRTQIQQMEQQLMQTQQLETNLETDLNKIQIATQNLIKKKASLSARQNRSAINDLLNHNGAPIYQETQDIFERWESNIVGTEFGQPEFTHNDPLASTFAEEEETLELKIFLDELTADQEKSGEKS